MEKINDFDKEGEIGMKSNRKSFIIKELKAVELSGWGAEYGAI